MARLAPNSSDRRASLDKAPQLVGQLNSDGIASLKEDTAYVIPKLSKSPRSLKMALEKTGRKGSDSTSNSGSEEDYDALKHDPGTVVRGGKGGGFASESLTDSGMTTPDPSATKSYEAIKIQSKSRPLPPRLKSIPVTLNKLNEDGRYVLTADDEALAEILKMGIERVWTVTYTGMDFC